MADQTQKPSDSTSSAPIKPRRKRRWLRWVGGLVLLLLVLVALLPTLVSWGIGKGLIRSTINKSVNGTVAIDSIKLAWFGGQSVKGFKIVDASGMQAVDVDVQVDSKLVQLLLNRNAPMNITVAGTVRGKRRTDGTLSFNDLVMQDKSGGSKTPKPPKPAGEPIRAPEIPPIALTLSGLTFDYSNEITKQSLVLDHMTGALTMSGPTQPIKIDLNAKTVANGTPGSVEMKGQITGLFDQRRALTLGGASVKLDVNARSAPLPLPTVSALITAMTLTVQSADLTGNIVATLTADGQVQGHDPSKITAEVALSHALTPAGEITLSNASASVRVEAQALPLAALGVEDLQGSVKTLKFSALSENLTDKIDLSLDSEAHLEGHDPSMLKALLTIELPFKPDGQPIVNIANLTGNVSGKVIPTAALQRFLNSTPIVASRDIGPTVDVDAAFSSGDARDVTIMAVGPKARLEVRGNINQTDQSLSGTHLLLTTPSAHPDLIKGFTDISVDRATEVEIKLTSFRLPPVDPKTESRPKTEYAATGSLKVKGPTVVMLAGDKPQKVSVEAAVVNIESPALKEYLHVFGSALLEGAGVTFDERITSLFDSTGALAAAGAKPVGMIEVKNLPTAVLLRFAPPEQADLINAVLGDACGAKVTTDLDGTDLRATVNATAALLTADITATRTPASLRVASAKSSLTLTPKLAQMLQKNETKPIQIQQPAAATLELQPFELPMTAPNVYALPAEPIKASLAVEDVVVSNVPALPEPVGLSKVTADLSAKLTEPKSYAIAGNAQVRRASADRTVTNLKYDIKAATTSDGDISPSGTLELKSVALRHLEQLLGQQRGGISQWAGDRGDVTIRFSAPTKDAYQATIDTKFPNLAGEFTASMQHEIVSLTAKTSTLTLSKTALERRMNPALAKNATAEEKKAAAAAKLKVDADVPLALAIQQLKFPLAMVQDGKPFDPATVDVDMSIMGGPISITTPDGVKTSLSDVDLKVNTKNLAEGMAFSLTSKAAAAVEEGGKLRKAGTIDVQGKIVDLVAQDSTLASDKARLQMIANVKNVPTMLADAFTNMEGLLVAAVGPVMNAKFDADDFSPDTGTLDARIDTTNGFLEAYVRGKDESLRSNKNKPISAELKITEPLRKRLLESVNPVFADVRTTKQPLRVEIPYAVIPTDGDISKLKADIDITIGEVEFDSGSTTLKIMSLFSESSRETIPGRIDPIHAKIRNGILKYDKFVMVIDKYEMPFTGQIDLVKKEMDLHTQLPLGALAVAIPQLEGKTDKIMVPLVIRGPIGKAKTKIDPDFDFAKALGDDALKGGLEDLLKGKGKGGDDLIGDIIGNITGNKKP